ncbi:MAG TPA: tyrosine-type recombinase/integrase [Phycisphaerales bacterium]|nr:tyrosine-type recombinase/integrase [Phycisphaerales bacterium]
MTLHVELHKRSVRYRSGQTATFWTLRWWGTDGKRYSESIGRVGEMTKHQAETARREKEHAIGGGTAPRDKPKAMTLAAFIEHDREAIRGTAKPDTLQSVKHAGAHAIQAWGADKQLSEITRESLTVLKKHLLHEKKLAPTTYGKTVRTLRAMFNRAVADGLMHANPLSKARLPKTPSRAKRIYSPDETRAMRQVSGRWWQVFIELAESSGLRKAELLHLQWTDIDGSARTVQVAGKRAGEFLSPEFGMLPMLEWTPKNHERRVVPLPQTVLDMLSAWRAEGDGSPYVFLRCRRLAKLAAVLKVKGRLGENYELVNNLKARFDLIQVKARQLLANERDVSVESITWPHGSIHDLRRTYGTRMARIVPMHVLKEYMGHAKITTTQEYYLAAETEDAERARIAMEALLNGGRTR